MNARASFSILRRAGVPVRLDPPIVNGRVPPHDLDAEAAVLSAILLSRDRTRSETRRGGSRRWNLRLERGPEEHEHGDPAGHLRSGGVYERAEVIRLCRRT